MSKLLHRKPREGLPAVTFKVMKVSVHNTHTHNAA